MKSGITLALLLGVASSVAGAAGKAMHWSNSNGLLIAGLAIAATAVVFWVLQRAPKQND